MPRKSHEERAESRKKVEELTPFAQLLVRYMNSQWPFMTISEFSQRVGLSAQGVYNYFYKGIVPRPATLELIAERTGISLGELFTAAGINMAEVTTIQALERLKAAVSADAVWNAEEKDARLRYLDSIGQDLSAHLGES